MNGGLAIVELVEARHLALEVFLDVGPIGLLVHLGVLTDRSHTTSVAVDFEAVLDVDRVCQLLHKSDSDAAAVEQIVMPAQPVGGVVRHELIPNLTILQAGLYRSLDVLVVGILFVCLIGGQGGVLVRDEQVRLGLVLRSLHPRCPADSSATPTFLYASLELLDCRDLQPRVPRVRSQIGGAVILEERERGTGAALNRREGEQNKCMFA